VLEVNVAIVNLGAGEVILDLPPGDLYPPGESQITKPATPSAQNLRLLDNMARVRPGYTALGAKEDSNPVTGLFNAVFDDGTVFTIRATKAKLYSWNGTVYADKSGGADFTALTDTDYWSFAMVPRTGAVSPKNEVFACDGQHEIKAWTGSGDFADVASSPTGGRAITAFLDRCFVGNVEDSGGDRKHTRIAYSIVGDGRSFSGTGSGILDLGDDPYAISVLTEMGGGLIVGKGDANGGSLIRGTPTGLVNAPVRYVTMNPGAGVGVLLRRAFLVLAPGVAFFVGHDGLYLWDGMQGLRRIAEGLVRTLLRRIAQDSLDAAHAWYKHHTGEVHLAIPTTGSTVPDEVWVYNLKENRTYGPYAYGHSLISSAPYIRSGALDWDSGMDYAGGWSTLPWAAWNAIGGPRGNLSSSYGATNGELYNDVDDDTEDDAGLAVTGAYTTGTIRAENRVGMSPSGGQRRLTQHSMLAIGDVTIEYAAGIAWTPVVAISTDDGGMWTTISDGAELAAGSGTTERKTYTTQIAGKRFAVRVSSSTRFDLHAIYIRATHVGDERAG
jgi:hypothetical protein